MSAARSHSFIVGDRQGFWWEWVRNLIRTVLVALVALLAIAIPQFLTIVGLVSGLSLIATSLVFPPMCYVKCVTSTAPKPLHPSCSLTAPELCWCVTVSCTGTFGTS